MASEIPRPAHPQARSIARVPSIQRRSGKRLSGGFQDGHCHAGRIPANSGADNFDPVNLRIIRPDPGMSQRIQGGFQAVIQITAASIRRCQCELDGQPPNQRQARLPGD